MKPSRRMILIGGAAALALAAGAVLATNQARTHSVATPRTSLPATVTTSSAATVTTSSAATVTTSSAATTTTIPSVELPTAISADSSNWTLVFDEPFDGAELGPMWTTCYWWQVDGGCTIASNDELQWYRPESVRVVDGMLQLQAIADPQLTTDAGMLPYRSGMASTGPVDDDGGAAGFVFTFGYAEAVVRFPPGAGTWPAVWLLSADLTSTPEVDIIEHYGTETVVKSRVHQRVDGEKLSEGFKTEFVPTADGWHRVAVLWTKERVEFYFDDVLTGVVDDEKLVPTTPMYLIVNLAMGGSAGPVDELALPQYFDIDSIRVWQEASI